jgi:hypothetical protein
MLLVAQGHVTEQKKMADAANAKVAAEVDARKREGEATELRFKHREGDLLNRMAELEVMVGRQHVQQRVERGLAPITRARAVNATPYHCVLSTFRAVLVAQNGDLTEDRDAWRSSYHQLKEDKQRALEHAQQTVGCHRF